MVAAANFGHGGEMDRLFYFIFAISVFIARRFVAMGGSS